MAESATILIPDISGYTEFLTKTELVHSSHIINELLEAILAANDNDFVLSEVEGDALLLYRKGTPIEADALVRQCVGMFESFHKQIKIIERDSLCQCGAGKTASNLSLKFIAHHGTVQEIKVMQFTKCSGLDMVVAHRDQRRVRTPVRTQDVDGRILFDPHRRLAGPGPAQQCLASGLNFDGAGPARAAPGSAQQAHAAAGTQQHQDVSGAQRFGDGTDCAARHQAASHPCVFTRRVWSSLFRSEMAR